MTSHAIPIFDRFTVRMSNRVRGFLDNMDDRTTCEVKVAASWKGFDIPACDNRAVVSDRNTELQFCRECYRKYDRGDWL